MNKIRNLVLLAILLLFSNNMMAQANDPMKFIGKGIKALEKHRVVAGGHEQTMIIGSEGNVQNRVTVVYLVPDKFQGPMRPPRVTAVIYHDIGEDKEFCSLQTRHYNIDPDTRECSLITLEQKVDDDVANIILDLIYGRTKYEDLSDIKLYRTESPQIAKPHIKKFEQYTPEF